MSDGHLEKVGEKLDRFHEQQLARARAVPIDKFLAVDYPPIEELIPGVIAAGCNSLIHSWRGVGKSQLATTLSISLAAGRSTLPGFEVTRRARVLYVDGEMPPALVQERFRLHADMLDLPLEELADHLRVLSRIAVQRESGERLASLATAAGREWLLRELEVFPAEVVMVDTVRAMMRHPEHSLSDEEGWRPVEELLAELNVAGVAVSYCHHDGKSGDQLGTSAREFDPSYVLHLERSKKRSAGFCRFDLSETKGRLGPGFGSREYVLEPEFAGRGSCWTIVEKSERTKAERILEFDARNPGLDSEVVAEAVGSTGSYVRNVRSRARRAAE